MLTGNGVAFVLRVPGTAHGDWWSLRGWWIFVATAAVSLLSKHVIKWRGEHVFNPSNIGLVICFLALGRNRAAPLDFWWGPMSAWLVLALVVIVTGGFAILRRLHLLRVALGFWASFTAGIGILALAGHTMTARWHLGPISGFHLWWVLVTSPEVLVFLFFMITDPKTAPRLRRRASPTRSRSGCWPPLLIAPTTTEFAAKVALLGALAIVCTAMPLLRLVPRPLDRRRALVLASTLVAAATAAMVLANPPSAATAFRSLPPGSPSADLDPPVARRADGARPPHRRAHRARPARGRARERERVPPHLAPAGQGPGPADGRRAARRRHVQPAPDRDRPLGASVGGRREARRGGARQPGARACAPEQRGAVRRAGLPAGLVPLRRLRTTSGR